MIKIQDRTLRSLPIRYKTTNEIEEAVLKQQDSHKKNTPNLRSQRVNSNFTNEIELRRARHSNPTDCLNMLYALLETFGINADTAVLTRCSSLATGHALTDRRTCKVQSVLEK
jgi:hypothetical protein